MKIEAFSDKWNIEVTEYYVKVTSSNGKTATMTDYNTDFSKVLGVIIYDEEVAPQDQIISSDKDADVFFDSVFNAKEPNQLLKDASQDQPTDIEGYKWGNIKRDGRSTINELNSAISKDQPTDHDGTPLEYGDRIVCVKEFDCGSGFHWEVGDMDVYFKQSNLLHSKELTPSELKNFRKLK